MRAFIPRRWPKQPEPLDWCPSFIVLGGEWPFAKCKCGKWLDPKTREHVITKTLAEFLGEQDDTDQICEERFDLPPGSEFPSPRR